MFLTLEHSVIVSSSQCGGRGGGGSTYDRGVGIRIILPSSQKK